MGATVTRLLWGVCLLSVAGQVRSQEFLRATVRDFFVGHPDMERRLDFDVFVPEANIVLPQLGEDGKPVFNSDGLPFRTVSNQLNFDQWYRHVDGINTNAALALFNSAASDGFRIADESFFPIDNFLFGNQLNIHNYHFTVESHGTFLYQPGATASFTGDDDFWLFVDDRLVIDLGGVHDRLTAEADLDILDLVPGQEYPISFFFAERHTFESRFLLETSFEIEQSPSDIDGDGQLTTYDLDELCRFGIAENIQFVGFDVNLDQGVNEQDLDAFLDDAASLRGDVNLDGAVTFADFLVLSTNFGNSDGRWSQGDLSCNARVDFNDFLILSAQFGRTSASGNVAFVPEPEASVVLGVLAAYLPAIRRRKRSRSS